MRSQTLYGLSIFTLFHQGALGHKHPNWAPGPPQQQPSSTVAAPLDAVVPTDSTDGRVVQQYNPPGNPPGQGPTAQGATAQGPTAQGATAQGPIQTDSPNPIGQPSPSLGGGNPPPSVGNSLPTPSTGGNAPYGGNGTSPSQTLGVGSPSGTGSAPITSGTNQSGGGQVCINWSGDFNWAMAGGFGSDTGSGGEGASKCWDSSVTGAAMFICESECNASGDAAPAKYTKFECTLSSSWPNCDMSIVDGFSLPAACTFVDSTGSSVTIGGTENLFDMATCDSPAGDNTCANAYAYNSSASDVSQFFQNGVTGGNNYCNFQTCDATSDPSWDPSSPPTINCQVGAGKSKRDLETVAAPVNQADALKRELAAGKSKRDLKTITAPVNQADALKRDIAADMAGDFKRAVHGGARNHARNLKSHL